MKREVETKQILIIARRPEIYANQRLVQELHRQHVPYQIIDPESQILQPAAQRSAIGLLRIASWRFQEAMECLLAVSEVMPLVNSLHSLQSSRNKWLSLQMIAKNKIATPLTQMVSREEFEYIEFEFPFVLKELFSTQGLGVYLIKSKLDLQKILTENKASNLFIVQENIQECHGQDLRILVTRKGDYWSMKRSNEQGDFRSNLKMGGIVKKALPSLDELQMAFSTLDIFGLDYAGVDILQTSQGPLMIDVNPVPGFEGLEQIHGPQVAGALVDLVLSKI